MKRYFTRNIETEGRIVRGLIGVVLLVTAIVSFQFSASPGLLLMVAGLFVLFEALRGWCALRACGIRTKI
jgi:membrane-bound ClpP family serine protease